jgi:hypothetical protein
VLLRTATLLSTVLTAPGAFTSIMLCHAQPAEDD